jgi:hypothetical protein
MPVDTHFTFLGAIVLPNVTGTPAKLIRWGQNGLALLTSGSSGSGQPGGVFLISGNFVTNPAAQYPNT